MSETKTFETALLPTSYFQFNIEIGYSYKSKTQAIVKVTFYHTQSMKWKKCIVYAPWTIFNNINKVGSKKIREEKEFSKNRTNAYYCKEKNVKSHTQRNAIEKR